MNSISLPSGQLPEKVKSAIDLVQAEGSLTTIVKNSRDESFSATYSKFVVVGHGSFGAVFLAQQSFGSASEPDSLVAIKMVYQDRRYKNDQDVYLFLILEYIPDTLYHLSQSFQKSKKTVSIEELKILKALEYLHSKNICHRDIKPQNLLVDLESKTLKLCDFGSAKILIRGEPNVSYICSRYYRAPELLLSATDYSYAVDIWSAGCVMAELILNTPLFPGTNDLDQMVHIIRILGSPTAEDLDAMNCSQNNVKFSLVSPTPWDKVLPTEFSSDPLTTNFLSSLLKYSPLNRITAADALKHPFFDSIFSIDPIPTIAVKDVPIGVTISSTTESTIAQS